MKKMLFAFVLTIVLTCSTSLIDNDTATDKKLYVWIPLKSIDEVESLDQKIEKMDPMGFEGIIHLENADSSLPYNRVETILTKEFKGQPQYEKKTSLVKEKNDARIYEYRSYEVLLRICT